VTEGFEQQFCFARWGWAYIEQTSQQGKSCAALSSLDLQIDWNHFLKLLHARPATCILCQVREDSQSLTPIVWRFRGRKNHRFVTENPRPDEVPRGCSCNTNLCTSEERDCATAYKANQNIRALASRWLDGLGHTREETGVDV
jgi:hypothetical protein